MLKLGSLTLYIVTDGGFRLDGRKTSHVAIYVGERSFVHAPSGGKRVERIDFDHVYWGPRLARAGRILY